VKFLRRHLGTIVFIAILFAWLMWGATWFDKPGTYRLVLLYLICGLLVFPFHIYATFRFNRMVRNVHKDERLGLADPGSTTFAVNQRFRYIARTIEATLIIAVSVLGILALNNKGVRTSHNYIRLVVTYLVGSVVLTGYLTWRDLRVINIIRDKSRDDAAALRPVLHYRMPFVQDKQKEEQDDGSKS
jgi:hypothetical protein